MLRAVVHGDFPNHPVGAVHWFVVRRWLAETRGALRIHGGGYGRLRHRSGWTNKGRGVRERAKITVWLQSNLIARTFL